MKSILFLGKAEDQFTLSALAEWQRHFDVQPHLGAWGDPLPMSAKEWEGDYIISFLSRWVVAPALLKRAKIAALNFHPAPPEYPGIGCNNFALYDNAAQYGATCHHMAPKLDAGPIVAVRRFNVAPDETVASLLEKTYSIQLDLNRDIVRCIIQNEPLPTSNETWRKRAYTRKEFDELCKLTPDMTKEEMARRIRATNFGRWKPTIEVNGFVFELKA